jgi:hypothetical protein
VTRSSALNKLFKITEEKRQVVFDWQTVQTITFTSIGWAILLIGLLIYFIRNPEKAEKWASIIARLFSFISLKLEKSGVAKDIQSDINSFAKEVKSQTKEPILPYKVKVKWVNGITRESFVKNGNVVVRMHHHKNQAKNFLYATLEWVDKGLIPEARHLLDKTVLRAVDFVFINEFLTKKKRYDVKQLFLDEIYEPEVTKGSSLERYCDTFNKLNNTGLFTGVALQEFSCISKKIGSAIPDEKIRFETIGFMNMLEKLARRSHGEDVSPTYIGEKIKCSIVLIARYEKYLTHGLSPYLGWINKCCKEGICSFYVCAVGDPNIMIVRKIRDAYEESKKISVVSENTFPLNGSKAIVLCMETLSQPNAISQEQSEN